MHVIVTRLSSNDKHKILITMTGTGVYHRLNLKPRLKICFELYFCNLYKIMFFPCSIAYNFILKKYIFQVHITKVTG